MMGFEDDCFVILLFELKFCIVSFCLCEIGIINYLFISAISEHFKWEMQHIAFIVLTLQFSLGSFFPRLSMTKKVGKKV
jgi:hypothetical protein